MQKRYLGKFRNGTNRRPGWDYARPSLYFVTICTRDRIPWFGCVRNGIMGLSETGSIATDEWIHMGTLRPNIVLDEWIVMPDHMHGIIVILSRIPPIIGARAPLNGGTNRDTSAQWDARASWDDDHHAIVRAPLNGGTDRDTSAQWDARASWDDDHHAIVRAPLNGGTDRDTSAQWDARASWDDDHHAIVRAPLNGAPRIPSHCADTPPMRNSHHLPNWNPGALGPIIQQFKRACTIRTLALGHHNFAWQPRFHDHIIRSSAEADRIRTYIRNNPKNWPT